ncbi:MAG: hypothetical protein PQJ44_00455, partial [Sphaerochaetaceae bacterium]|nr:hypothetical protein [Sphaerochaetaceae bacterium]
SQFGIFGIIIAILLGAGPAGTRYSYVVFFLGVWLGLKLLILIYEGTYFGMKFTIVHFITVFILFLITSLLLEKLITKKDLEEIEKTSAMML